MLNYLIYAPDGGYWYVAMDCRQFYTAHHSTRQQQFQTAAQHLSIYAIYIHPWVVSELIDTLMSLNGS